MARVTMWWCFDCGAEWLAPVGNVNHVVTRGCRSCGGKHAQAWGRVAKEDWVLEVVDEEGL